MGLKYYIIDDFSTRRENIPPPEELTLQDFVIKLLLVDITSAMQFFDTLS